MNEEHQQQNATEEVETRHEPHEHASRRLLVGVGAVIIVFVLGSIVWARWGENLGEACFGGEEACSTNLEQSDQPEKTGFSVPESYNFESEITDTTSN